MLTKTIASACALALLLPATALAKNGENPTPPAGPPACNALVTQTPFQSINRKAKATLKFKLENCTEAVQQVTVNITSTAEILELNAPPVTCDAGTFSTDPVTLRPGDTASVTGQMPSSDCPLGGAGTVFTLDIQAVDAISGAVVGSDQGTVRVNPNF